VGAKTSLFASCNGDARKILRAQPPLDRDAARGFAEQLTGQALAIA
jgi:hypothetical protein